jgi:hypothetical protein
LARVVEGVLNHIIVFCDSTQVGAQMTSPALVTDKAFPQTESGDFCHHLTESQPFRPGVTGHRFATIVSGSAQADLDEEE